MKLRILGVIILALGLLCPSAMAAEQGTIKVATISLQEIITKSKAGKQAQKSLESKAGELKGKFQGEEDELEKMQKEIEVKGSVWSHDVRTEKEREYQKKLRELQAKSEDAQFELKQLDNKVMEPILIALHEVLEDVGKKYGYTMIMENSRKGIKSRTGLMYADQSLDISDLVIKELDSKMSSKK